MKPLVKTLAGAAVLLVALAGCASKSTTGASAPVAGSTGSVSSPAVPQNPQSTPGSPSDSTPSPVAGSSKTSPSTLPPTGIQVPAPTPYPSKISGGPGTKPTAPSTDQVKYISPEGVSLGADGRTLTTPVQWGGCAEQPQLIATAQDSAKVVVEVKTITHFRLGAMCPDIARLGQAALKLDAPLGGRQVIDAITQAVLPVR